LSPVQQGRELDSLDSAGNFEMAEQPVEMRFHGSASDVELASYFGVLTALHQQLDNLRTRALARKVSAPEGAAWRQGHQRLPLRYDRMIVVLPCHVVERGFANAQETRRQLIVPFASVEGGNDGEALHLIQWKNRQWKNRAQWLLGRVTKRTHECHHPLSCVLSELRVLSVLHRLSVEGAMLNN
jgi:hypothetical protein